LTIRNRELKEQAEEEMNMWLEKNSLSGVYDPDFLGVNLSHTEGFKPKTFKEMKTSLKVEMDIK